MEKLKLKSLKLGTIEVLTRAQMKNVSGGLAKKKCYETDRCWACCKDQGHGQQYCDSYCG